MNWDLAWPAPPKTRPRSTMPRITRSMAGTFPPDGRNIFPRLRTFGRDMIDLLTILAGGVALAPRFSAKPVCVIMVRPSLPARRPYAGRGRAGARSARRRTRTGRLDSLSVERLHDQGA